MEESERIYTKIIRSIEKQSGEVKEMIKSQERLVISQAEEMLERIQRDMAEHRRTEAELEKLSHTEDHIHFLQVWMVFISSIYALVMPAVFHNPNKTNVVVTIKGTADLRIMVKKQKSLSVYKGKSFPTSAKQ